jgi:AcrR family transcriptional regulator
MGALRQKMLCNQNNPDNRIHCGYRTHVSATAGYRGGPALSESGEIFQPAVTSRRESAKDGRRTRIVEAAAVLLRETPFEELSVKMIADRADVSPATVYNLFGTKTAVMQKVYELGLLQYERQVSKMRSKDALELVFDSVTLTASQIRADPNFARTMVEKGDHGGDSAYALANHRLRVAYWSAILLQALEAGLLLPTANTDLLSVMMIQVSSGALSHWATHLISIDRLESEIQYGLAALLHSFATPAAQSRLATRMRRLEKTLLCGG